MTAPTEDEVGELVSSWVLAYKPGISEISYDALVNRIVGYCGEVCRGSSLTANVPSLSEEYRYPIACPMHGIVEAACPQCSKERLTAHEANSVSHDAKAEAVRMMFQYGKAIHLKTVGATEEADRLRAECLAWANSSAVASPPKQDALAVIEVVRNEVGPYGIRNGSVQRIRDALAAYDKGQAPRVRIFEWRYVMTSIVAGKLFNEIAQGLWQDLLDKDDRTSPEDRPDMALITFDEFAAVFDEGRMLALAADTDAPCHEAATEAWNEAIAACLDRCSPPKFCEHAEMESDTGAWICSQLGGCDCEQLSAACEQIKALQCIGRLTPAVAADTEALMKEAEELLTFADSQNPDWYDRRDKLRRLIASLRKGAGT